MTNKPMAVQIRAAIAIESPTVMEKELLAQTSLLAANTIAPQ